MEKELEQLTIIIPVWNEAESIYKVLMEFTLIPEFSNTSIIVVDDGSTDTTNKKINKCCVINKMIKNIHINHSGKDKALWKGVADAKTKWAGVIDGDGQYNPYDFIKLLSRLTELNADAIWGIRINRKDNYLRKLSSYIGKTTMKLFIRQSKLRDPGCGIFIIKKELWHEIINICQNPKGQLHCFLAELVSELNGRVIEFEVEHRKREKGHAKYGINNRFISGLLSLLQACSIRKKIRNCYIRSVNRC
jgi:dolichol-phosphate mannosyltransferase